MAEDTRPVVDAGEHDGLAAYYAVNATGAYKRPEEALYLAEFSYPGEPPPEWASALGHLRLAVADMGAALEKDA